MKFSGDGTLDTRKGNARLGAQRNEGFCDSLVQLNLRLKQRGEGQFKYSRLCTGRPSNCEINLHLE